MAVPVKRSPDGRILRRRFNETRKRRFLELLAQGYSRTASAIMVGVSANTLAREYDNDPAFKDEADAIAGERAYGPESTFTEDKKALYVECLSEGMTHAAAARFVGVSASLAYVHRLKDQAFAEACRQAQEIGVEAVEDSLYQACTIDRNVKAMEVYLYNRCPERWKNQRALILQAGNPMDASTMIDDPLQATPDALAFRPSQHQLKAIS